MHCGLSFSDNESESGFSGLDDSDSDSDSDDEDDEEDESDDSDNSMAERFDAYIHGHNLADDFLGVIYPPWIGFPSDAEVDEMSDDHASGTRGGILWDDEAEDDEDGSDDEDDEDDDEDDEDVDSFIDQRSESEILAEGLDFDDTDISIPYHTRENNYYTQMDSSTEHPNSDDEDDDEEEEEEPQTSRWRRLQRSRIDTDEVSEESSDTVRGTQSSIPSLRGRITRSRARPAIHLSDED
jgi:hypothetical protein